jgi:hypothetical protein
LPNSFEDGRCDALPFPREALLMRLEVRSALADMVTPELFRFTRVTILMMLSPNSWNTSAPTTRLFATLLMRFVRRPSEFARRRRLLHLPSRPLRHDRYSFHASNPFVIFRTCQRVLTAKVAGVWPPLVARIKFNFHERRFRLPKPRAEPIFYPTVVRYLNSREERR